MRFLMKKMTYKKYSTAQKVKKVPYTGFLRPKKVDKFI